MNQNINPQTNNDSQVTPPTNSSDVQMTQHGQQRKSGDVRYRQNNNRMRNNRPPRSIVGPKFDTTVSAKSELGHIPKLKDGDIRIIHFGGVEEIGRNMSMVEYKDTILIVDCGVQFTEKHTPGIDFILPNTRYLEENKHKIKGMLVTHGHLDHIGAIPYVMPRIGTPQIYARLFTSLMIRKRQEEFPIGTTSR
jgi:hypothetical protein